MLKMAISMKSDVQDIRKALISCLGPVPSAKIRAIKAGSGDSDPDAIVRLQAPDGPRTIAIECKRSGQPRPAREAVNQLLRYVGTDNFTYGVFMAPYISERSAEICAKEGIGYIDLAGNCRLSFDGIYIERSGRPNPRPQRRELRSLYSPKATRVLRVLLASPKRRWKLEALAKEATVSLGQVANVKKRLLDREWIVSEVGGIFLKEPEPLLREWAASYESRKNQSESFYSLTDIDEVEVEIADRCREMRLRYALTAFSGAVRLAPAVRYLRAYAFVDEPGKLADLLGLKRVDSGENVVLLTPYDNGVFYDSRVIDGVRVASPIQLFLDLSSIRGRGEEAAEALLDQEIRPKW